MTIIAAADGSALGNPGPAGWAWYVDDDHWASGGWAHGTNNMGELMAVLDLLQQTAHLDRRLEVLCDSQYVIRSITEWMPGWKRRQWRKGDGKPVQNVALMKALDAALGARQVEFTWVKGHAGHRLNEAADVLARAAATAFADGALPTTGPGWTGASTDHPEAHPGQTEAPGTLFDADDQLDPDAGRLDEIDVVIGLERDLLSDAVRSDPAAVAALLHPDFHEIGRSGRLWSHAEMVAAIGPLPAPVELEVVSASHPAADQVLLIWRATHAETATMRSSLWHRGRSGWRLYFHQGTPLG